MNTFIGINTILAIGFHEVVSVIFCFVVTSFLQLIFIPTNLYIFGDFFLLQIYTKKITQLHSHIPPPHKKMVKTW